MTVNPTDLGYHQLHSCNDDTCKTCRGGLAWCDVCHTGEGAMPTHCPGRHITTDEADSIYACRLDFKDGQWIVPQTGEPR